MLYRVAADLYCMAGTFIAWDGAEMKHRETITEHQKAGLKRRGTMSARPDAVRPRPDPNGHGANQSRHGAKLFDPAPTLAGTARCNIGTARCCSTLPAPYLRGANLFRHGAMLLDPVPILYCMDRYYIDMPQCYLGTTPGKGQIESNGNIRAHPQEALHCPKMKEIPCRDATIHLKDWHRGPADSPTRALPGCPATAFGHAAGRW